jgi:hypothetical protein
MSTVEKKFPSPILHEEGQNIPLFVILAAPVIRRKEVNL